MAEYTPPEKFQLFPISVIKHRSTDSSATNTSTDKNDVEKETEDLVKQDNGESKWFDIFAGILVSTVPMILGGYILYLLTDRSEASENEP